MDGLESGLVALLEKHQVPWQDWGKGEAKTLDHLLNELTDEQVTLTPDQNGRLIRHVFGAGVDAFFEDGTGKLRLVEDRQVFGDGRERRRPTETSIGEKLKRNEPSIVGARRAIAEELGITAKLELVFTHRSKREPEISRSYPGLWTIYEHNMFEVTLPPVLNLPEGYIERRPNLTSYFVWQRVE